jgi:toxin ParE1/3/4
VSRQAVFRPKAVADLDAIWRYTARHWGSTQADAYVRAIVETCRAVARGERTGTDASDLRPGYRKLRIGRHVAFYRPQDDGSVEFVRILHERMDLPSRLDPH